MLARVVAFVALAALRCAAAAADCRPVDMGSRQYLDAVRVVQALPEFKEWRRYVAAHPPARVLLGVGSFARSERIGGRCYIPVTIYSDEVTHLHRWNTFHVSLRPRRVLVMNLEGDPVGLREWRRYQAELSRAGSGR